MNCLPSLREGYIKKYRTIIDPERFGKNLPIIFNFDVNLDNLRQTVKELKSFNCLTDVYIAASNPSIVAFGNFKDKNQLNEFLMNDLSRLPIKGYKVTTILEKVKENIYSI